jgi:hypothetical protein
MRNGRRGGEGIMSLSYRYTFCAPAKTSAEELEEFLNSVEADAKALGFTPTTVLNVRFETPEQRDFARRLGGSCVLEDDRLKGDLRLRDDQVWHHHRESGTVRLIPQQGVVLLITDERGREACFGCLKYPSEIRDTAGRLIMATHFGGHWRFRDFVQTSDPRYRKLVERFRAAGYLETEEDEFAKNNHVPEVDG